MNFSIRRSMRVMALVAGMALGGVALAQPALAATWGPLSSSYDGKVRVRGKGDFTKHLSAYARNRITVTDARSDGNNVYGRTDFQFWRNASTGEWAWFSSGSKSTPEHSGYGVTRTTDLQVGLRADSSQARGVSRVCAQMGWPVPDSCSTGAFSTFNY